MNVTDMSLGEAVEYCQTQGYDLSIPDEDADLDLDANVRISAIDYGDGVISVWYQYI